MVCGGHGRESGRKKEAIKTQIKSLRRSAPGGGRALFSGPAVAAVGARRLNGSQEDPLLSSTD
jgi:hypothetical protein